MIYIYIISSASHNQETEAQIEVEEAAQVLERFVDGTSRTNAYPPALLESTLSLVAPDYPNTYWLHTGDPQRQDEKLVLIREIVDAMPELNMIYILHEVFVTRCQGPLGNIAHTPTYLKQAENLCSCLNLASPEAQVMALFDTFTMETLACQLLAVRMRLYPASSVCSRFILSTACARSRLSPNTSSTWLVPYTFDSSCGRVSNNRCAC